MSRKIIYILGLAAVLMLTRISQVDLTSDNAHYAIRSIGYVDTMFSDKQTTPLNWFAKFPWWGDLSFHDHPPLLFFVQHIFLLVRESIFFAKLPYVLFSLGTIYLLYIFARDLYGEETGLWSALFLSLNSLFIYNARAGFMEAGVVFFIVLTIYFFTRFLQNQKYWWAVGLSLGLSFLAKYSAFFLIPALIGYLVIANRQLLKDKRIYGAFLLAILIASPIIIYNIMMYKATGHFDYQFSRLFHTASPWVSPAVSGIVNPLTFFTILAKTVTWPYLFLSLIGLAYAIFVKKKMYLFGLCFIFLTLMFMVTDANKNHLNTYNIFLAVPLAYLAVAIRNTEKIRNIKVITNIFAWCFVFYFGLVAINSHILIMPFAQRSVGWLISAAKSENFGIYQLDQYLGKLIKEKKILSTRDGYYEMKAKKLSLQKRFGTKDEALRAPAREYDDMIIYDDDLNWFAELWPFTRRRFYHNIPILNIEEFIRFSKDITIKKIYFVKAAENTMLEADGALSDASIKFENLLIESAVKPIDRIYRTDGRGAFRVYMFDAKFKPI